MWKRAKESIQPISAPEVEEKGTILKDAAMSALQAFGARALHELSAADVGERAHGIQDSASRWYAKGSDAAKKSAKDAAKAYGDTVTKTAKSAGDNVQAASSALSSVAQMASSAAQKMAKDGKIADNQGAQKALQGVSLVASALSSATGPNGSLENVIKNHVDTDRLAKRTRDTIDSTADIAQQRIKTIIDAAKDALSNVAASLTDTIETAEESVHEALNQTEKTLASKTTETAKRAKNAIPNPEPKKSGGTLRWLFYGLLIGGVIAFVMSPMSGPLGDRVALLKRDLGFGAGEEDDSHYWPSPPQNAPHAPEAD